jgi:hypothetical protein
MSVDYGGNVPTCSEQIPMKSPLARGSAAAEPAPFEVHEWHVLRFERLVLHAARTDEEGMIIAPHADVARRAGRESPMRELTTRSDYCLA